MVLLTVRVLESEVWIAHKSHVGYILGRESMVVEEEKTRCRHKGRVRVGRAQMLNMEPPETVRHQLGNGRMGMQADIDFGADSSQMMLSAGCKSGHPVVVAVEGLERCCKLPVSCNCADRRRAMAGAVDRKLGRRRGHKADDHSSCTL